MAVSLKIDNIGKGRQREESLICGYDPMNMIMCGRQLLCTHFVVLKIGENMRFLNGPVLLKLKKSAGREVEEYWVLPREKDEPSVTAYRTVDGIDLVDML